MKRIISAFLIIITLISCSVFCVSASVYSSSGFRFELPEEMVVNNKRAEESNSTRAWNTENERFVVDILIDDNRNKGSYINLSEDDIRKVYNSYTANQDSPHSLLSGRNIDVSGFEGFRMDIEYESDDADVIHTVCAFSTAEKVYTIYFYVFDDDYSDYVDSIIDTISIAGKPYSDSFKNIMGNLFYVFAIIFVLCAVVYIFRKKPTQSKKIPKAAKKESVRESEGVSFSDKGYGASDNSNDSKTYNVIEKF